MKSMSKKKKINQELIEKYKIGEKIKTRFGDLPIVGFMEFKRYCCEEYMMFPYLEYNNKKYTFAEEENSDGVHFIIEIIDK